MKPNKLVIGAAAAAVALALTVFSTGPLASTPAAQAKGPLNLQFDSALSGTLGTAGSPVSSTVVINIDAPGGTPNAAPSDTAFFDNTLTTFTSIQPAAGSPSGGNAQTGSKAGTISFKIQTNQYPLTLADSISPNLNYEVPKCGDNTRNYDGGGGSNGLFITAAPLEMWNANMANTAQPTYLFATDAGFSLATFQAEHPLDGNPGGGNEDTNWIQSYDDDNRNGIPDSQEPGVAGTAEPAAAQPDPSNPLYNNALTRAASTRYLKGTPETQEDYDDDGIPNAVEYMVDYIPKLVDSMGLSAFWVSRQYGAAATFQGLVPPTDVHFMGIAYPDGSSNTVTNLANPFVPSNPLNQRTVTCTPFNVTVNFNSTLQAPDFNGDGDSADGPEATRNTSATVSTVSVAGGGTISLAFSDTDDNDQDGIASPYDLCGVSNVNSDADNDLVSGPCDLVTGSANNTAGTAFMTEGAGVAPDFAPAEATCFDGADNDGDTLVDFADTNNCGGGTIYDNDVDGDGFINDVDNCPTTSNPTQANADSDSVGDACDNLVTTDTFTLLTSGKGDGTATSATLDNDQLCTDTYTTSETLSGDATCAAYRDANDDGTPDSLSIDTDEDGDGFSDACEDAAQNGGADADGDKLPDVCEAQLGTNPAVADTDGDGAKDGVEVAVGTDPLVSGGYSSVANVDTDGDGCADIYEKNNNLHPGYFWDIFDVGSSRGATSAPGDENFTADHKVNFSDVLITLDHFGHNATAAPPGPVDAFDKWLDRVNRKTAADSVLKPAGFGSPAPIDRGNGATLPLQKTFMFEQEKAVNFTDVLAALDGFGIDCSSGGNVGTSIVNPTTGAGIPNLGGIHP